MTLLRDRGILDSLATICPLPALRANARSTLRRNVTRKTFQSFGKSPLSDLLHANHHEKGRCRSTWSTRCVPSKPSSHLDLTERGVAINEPQRLAPIDKLQAVHRPQWSSRRRTEIRSGFCLRLACGSTLCASSIYLRGVHLK